MNLENLRAGNGFINETDLFFRMARRKPPVEEPFRLCRISKNFSEAVVIIYGQVVPLFKIWTGNPEVYLHIKELFVKMANQLDCKVQVND